MTEAEKQEDKSNMKKEDLKEVFSRVLKRLKSK